MIFTLYHCLSTFLASIAHTHITRTHSHTHTHTHTHTQINGRILYEGVIKIYWGLKKAITLAPGVMYAKSRNNRDSVYDFIGVDDAAYIMMLEEAQKVYNSLNLDRCALIVKLDLCTFMLHRTCTI